MKTTKELALRMESQGNAVSPGLAGNAMLTMDEIARLFREECDANRRFAQKVRPPAKGSFVLIFEFAVDADSPQQSFLEEHPLITRYMLILKEFFEWKVRLAGALPEIVRENIIFEEVEHRLDPISLHILDPASATSTYAARTFQGIEAEETIQEVCLSSDDSVEPFIRIPKASYPSFAVQEISVLEPQERHVVEDMLLTVESPVLTGRDIQWRFVNKGQPLVAKITHERFLESVKQSSEQFSNGDKLEAKMDILQQYDARLDTWVNKRYTVVEVTRHIRRQEQNSNQLFD